MKVYPERIVKIREKLENAIKYNDRSIALEAFSDRYVCLNDALAVYLALIGVEVIRYSVHKIGSRKDPLAVRLWKNNIEIICKSAEQAEDIYPLLRSYFGQATCGWRKDKSFGFGTSSGDYSSYTNLVATFLSLKPEIDKLNIDDEEI